MEEKIAPSSSNPADYARAVRVTDDDTLLLKARIDEHLRNLWRLHTEVEIARAEQAALTQRLFLRLDGVYPGIRRLDPDGGVGLRDWDDALWYVGWDGTECRP
jgi:hypothetical protein